MKKNQYDKKYFDERDTLDLLTAESIALFMKKQKLHDILDVGCGTGRLVKYLNSYGFEAKGCDLYDKALKIAKKINKINTIVKSDAGKLPFKNNSFDLITGISLIEHLSKKNGTLFIREARRILKRNGYIFLITPNFNSPLRFILREKWFGYSDPTHINFFTPLSLANLLKDYGFYSPKFWFKINNHQGLVKYFLFSTPLCFIRDSFWIAAQKR